MVNVRQFINKNLVVLTIVPLIAGSHYGWMKLQNVDVLVTEKERKNLPTIFRE